MHKKASQSTAGIWSNPGPLASRAMYWATPVSYLYEHRGAPIDISSPGRGWATLENPSGLLTVTAPLTASTAVIGAEPAGCPQVSHTRPDESHATELPPASIAAWLGPSPQLSH